MFKKKTVAPTTVSDAIAPFRQVRDNLLNVIAANDSRCLQATKRIEDAKSYAAQVEADETAAAANAKAEIDRAAKIADSLSALLGDLSTPENAEASA